MNRTALTPLVIRKNSDQDTESFGVAVLTSVLISASSVLAAWWLRGRFPTVFRRQGPTLEEPRRSLFGWAVASFRVTVDDVIDDAGLDQAMLLEFSHFAMRSMVAIGIPALSMLAPLHAQASKRAPDELSKISLNNASESWVVWVHAFFVWYVVIVMLALLWHAQRKRFHFRRKQWLEKMPGARATTILVEGIPAGERTESQVALFFGNVFGLAVVKHVAIVRDTFDLLPKIELRDALGGRLEEARAEAAKEQQGLELWGSPKAPAAQRMQEQLQELEGRFHRASHAAREEAIKICDSEHHAFDAAFVTFHDRRHAEFAGRLHYSDSPGVYEVSMAPDPSDVNFESFSNNAAMLTKGHALLGRLLVAAVFFLFLPIVIGISSVLSVESLSELVPSLRTWAQEHEGFAAAWDGLLGTSALTLIMDLVPEALRRIFEHFYRLRSGAKLQYKIQRWYFFFLTVYVLLVTTVGSSLFQAAARLAQRPLEVWWLLADELPDSTNFYLRYAVLAWSSPFFELMRAFQVLIFWRSLRAGESEDNAKASAEPEDQAFYGLGARSARWSLHLLLGLTLCSLQPLLCLIVALNFAFRRLVFGYLIVFVETRKSDSGGTFWKAQMQCTQLGLGIYIMVMTLVLLERDESLVPAVIAGSSGSALGLFWLWWPSLLKLQALPVADAELKLQQTIGCSTGVAPSVSGPQKVALSSRCSPYFQAELRRALVGKAERPDMDFELEMDEPEPAGATAVEPATGSSWGLSQEKSHSLLACLRCV
eukprot:TRINITY_DN96303_c0_g1_i1.p1 TRINITY_DN96303_c0_g1~~TRINITY_DN96303_c0_g1_i1.p1  ORF type:complete len:766 (+),score=167.00 TRINITY_DN96303_c0_g1_i1:113-2410(+)